MSVRRLWLVAVLALAPIAVGAEETTAPSEPVYRTQKPAAEPVEQPADEPIEAPGQPAQEPIAEPVPQPPAPRAQGQTPAPLLHGTLALSLPDAIKMGLE